MTTTELATFRARLASAVTDIDRKESAREAKRGRVNVYRLGIMLNAVAECCAEIEAGAQPWQAFARNFNPTREFHTFARAAGLPLDVERGRWVKVAPATV